jgi:hypothetical protein
MFQVFSIDSNGDEELASPLEFATVDEAYEYGLHQLQLHQDYFTIHPKNGEYAEDYFPARFFDQDDY